ncbi:putative UDP-glucose 4-epimerase [Cucurbitaria berberidis CBS 394.84]|uniref:UDP-glucose 4-epimerase n=1 Tax=Cucurbitaria berberidis CBS 394.84 TaxID=1168544 RepID=A0A9P4LE21_9PLEO|nr:putative UDP-glucose 4-epimerase [Cucurbitaria berberidis CBS 394.84]KAF1850684.1 putative UDP-glucose 4-epimerase [Cucurbitaria berberidis CBS 394.84]
MVVFANPFTFTSRHHRRSLPHSFVPQSLSERLVRDMLFSEENTPESSPGISRATTPGTERDVLFDPPSPLSDTDGYVLVTGGLGFIGSHTVVELMKEGHNVVIVDDLSNSASDVFDRILKTAHLHFARTGKRCPKVHFRNMNYRDVPAMRNLLDSVSLPGLQNERRSRFIGVIHFAAYKAVEESIRQPMRYYHNNVVGLLDFLALLDEYSVRTFIFSSSATVYGSLADGSKLLREEHCVHENGLYVDVDGNTKLSEPGYAGITSPYGRTKYFGEAILSDIARSDPRWRILALRYFNPVGCDVEGFLGEDPKGDPSNLLPVVVKVMTGQLSELSVYGDDWNTPDGTAVRDFIHVTDLAKGHTAALNAAQTRQIPAGFRTFNLGTGCGNSVTEVVKAMEGVSKVIIPSKIVSRRDGDVQSSVAAADRAKNELGWTTEKNLHDACRDTYNYLRLRTII